MDNLFTSYFTWWHLLQTAAWLIAIYLFLSLLNRWMALGRFGGAAFGRGTKQVLEAFLGKVNIFYEPVAVLVLGAVFVFINPPFHGAIMLVLLVAGFASFKNYINGRFMLLNSSVVKAKRIQTAAGEGIITRRGRLGLYLQTDEGLRHIPYSQLMENSFTLISGRDVERLWRMQLAPNGKAEVSQNQLLGLLASIPYLDRTYLPELTPLPDGAIETALLLKNEKYLPDFVQAIAEMGWDCKINN